MFSIGVKEEWTSQSLSSLWWFSLVDWWHCRSKCKSTSYQVSIASTFYEQLLNYQISCYSTSISPTFLHSRTILLETTGTYTHVFWPYPSVKWQNIEHNSTGGKADFRSFKSVCKMFMKLLLSKSIKVIVPKLLLCSII